MRFKILVIAILLAAAGLAQADTQLRLVMVDNSVLRGTLVSNDSQVLTLNVDGQVKKVPVDGIKKAYDASTGKPFDLAANVTAPATQAANDALSQGDEDEGQPDQGQPRRRRLRRARIAPSPRELSLRTEHEWFDMDFGWQVGALIGDDSSIKTFWTQYTGLDYDNDSNHLAMALDYDFLLRPVSWFAIGPFVTWNFDAPNADGSGNDGMGNDIRVRMDFQNVAYGARARVMMPIKNARGMETARGSLELSVGGLSLNDAGLSVWENGDQVQQIDFDGSTPYFGGGANFDVVLGPNIALQMGLGFQYARLSSIHYLFTQDDYSVVSQQGQSGTLTDQNTGANIVVDFTNIYAKFAFSFLF